jgi:hypothetical protein
VQPEAAWFAPPPPSDLPAVDGIALTAPGGGHNLYQLAEPGTQLTLNGAAVAVDADGRSSVPVSDAVLAAGIAWTARHGPGRGAVRRSWLGQDQ